MSNTQIDTLEFFRKTLRFLYPQDNFNDLAELAETFVSSSVAAERAWATLAQAHVASVRGNYELASETFRNAELQFSELQDIDGLYQVNRHFGYQRSKQGQAANAIELYGRSLEIAASQRLEHEEAWMRILIAHEQINVGAVDLALEQYCKALEIIEKIDAVADLPICHINIGNAYGYAGDYTNALISFRTALQHSERLKQDYSIANSLGNIGILYTITHQYNDALEYHKRSVEVCIRGNLKNQLAKSMQSLASAYSDVGDHVQAIATFKEALAHAFELHDVSLAESMRIQYAIALVNAGEHDDAELQLQAYEASGNSDRFNQINVFRCYADIYVFRGQTNEAIEVLQRAMELADIIDRDKSRELIHMQLRDIYKKTGDFENYLMHNDAAQSIIERTRNAEIIKRMTLQVKDDEIQAERIAREKERSVLYSTLPREIADRVAQGETVNDIINDAAVMFVDIVGFTDMASSLSPIEVAALLNSVFTVCDEACRKHGVTRIKTIGDSYMAVAYGEMPVQMPNAERQMPVQMPNAERQMPNQMSNAAVATANAAVQIIDQIQNVSVRIGLHTGPIVAGVLGTERLQYDVWGDTVNVASRMESTSEPNRIHVTETFANALSSLSDKERGLGESSLMLAPRGATEVKGKGLMQTYWLEKK